LPRLLIFAPCNKVLIDQDNNISLISIFQDVRIPKPENIPHDAQAVIQWDVLTVWGQVPEDDGRTYEQDVMVFGPDGSMTAHTKLQFSMAARTYRNISKIYGFPVSREGEYSLTLKLKDMQDDEHFIFEATFPMFVTHETKPEDSP